MEEDLQEQGLGEGTRTVIAISNDSSIATTAGSKRELRDWLAPCFDRLVRVSYIASKEHEPIVIKQRTGRMAELRYIGGYSSQMVYSDELSKLSLRFRGEESADELLIVESDTVEIFQEDSSSWKMLHCSPRIGELILKGFEL